MDAHNFRHTRHLGSPQARRLHRRRIGLVWLLALQTRAGEPHGLLHFWPFWERFTARLWHLQTIPGTTHGLLMLQLTRYWGKPIDLPDGTHVERGDSIGILHFRNQALLLATEQVNAWETLKWMKEDMRCLALWQQTANLKAIYGITLLSRAAPRLGFTLRRRPRSILTWFDRIFMLGLLALYHSRGLDRLAQGTTYNTSPQEAWMSLNRLIHYYGPGAPASRQQENEKGDL